MRLRVLELVGEKPIAIFDECEIENQEELESLARSTQGALPDMYVLVVTAKLDVPALDKRPADGA